MKKIFLIILALCLGMSVLFSQKTSSKVATINGKIKGLKINATVYLYEITLNGILPLDSVKSTKGGAFTFSLNAPEPLFVLVRITDKLFLKLMPSEGQIIQIGGNVNDNPTAFTVDGSPDSDFIMHTDSLVLTVQEKMFKLYELFNNPKGLSEIERDSLVMVENKLTYNLKKQLSDDIVNHLTSLATLNAINQNIGRKPLFTLEDDIILFEKVARSLEKEYPNNVHAKMFYTNVEQYLAYKREVDALESRVGVGVLAPDILLMDKDSVPFKLSSLKGKIVLLKFWNPSCDVCREENRKLKLLYSKYKEKGFEVMAVSIGTKRDEWLIVNEEDGTGIWKNVKIPEEGDNVPQLSSYFVALYGIKSVPFSFLIDANGIILAKGFTMDALEELLDSNLKSE